MDIEEALIERVSSPALVDPGPTGKQLELMFKAALRAPDHGRIRPWRFLTIKGEARDRLGDLFAKAAQSDQQDLSEDALNRYRGMPLRAPVLVALICKKQQHPKVPEIEQQLSLGAAAQNILNAAYAQGIGAMWRTGAISYHSLIASGLGLEENEELLGFIYLGTPSGSKKKLPVLNISDFVSAWE